MGTRQAGGDDDEIDLTRDEAYARYRGASPTIEDRQFNENEHRAKIAGKAVYLLMGLLYIIVIASWAALLLDHEVHYIELTIFAQLALVGIVSGPLLAFIFRSTP